MKKLVIVLLSFGIIPALHAQSDLVVHSEGGKLFLNHTVAPKENFYSIGRLYNITPKEIAPFNGLSLNSGLEINQEIKIPLLSGNFAQQGTAAGDEVFVPPQTALQMTLMLHELATNAGKYGAFASVRGLLQVSWSMSDDRLNITWDETEGPAVENVGPAGFGSKLLQSALRAFDGKTEIRYLKTGVHCTMQCRVPSA